MITGAATATINRLPVLLLPGDIFARRNVAPVLQQLESAQSQDVSVNDCFKPVSRYWDRINRPDQLLTVPAGGRARAHQPGRDRRGDPGAAAGRADRGLRLPRGLLPQARLAHPPQPARRRCAAAGRRVDPREPEAADRRRRRRDLLRGDRGAARVRRPDRHPGGRDHGRARAACATITRSTWARSGSPAPWPPTASPATPTW